MAKHTVCVMLQIEADDDRLAQEAIDQAMQTGDGVNRLRRAVLQHCPNDVTRVVAVFPPEHATLLMMLHQAVGDDIAKAAGLRPEEMPFIRPPADYKPPP